MLLIWWSLDGAVFYLELAVAAHTATECPAPQPIRRGLRPDISLGWKTLVVEPSPHIPCSFQPQEKRQPPEKERGHGSVELTVERWGCSTVACRLKLAAWGKNDWVQKTKKLKDCDHTQIRTHTYTHKRCCSQHWHSVGNKASLLFTAGELVGGCGQVCIAEETRAMATQLPNRLLLPWQQKRACFLKGNTSSSFPHPAVVCLSCHLFIYFIEEFLCLFVSLAGLWNSEASKIWICQQTHMFAPVNRPGCHASSLWLCDILPAIADALQTYVAPSLRFCMYFLSRQRLS